MTLALQIWKRIISIYLRISKQWQHKFWRLNKKSFLLTISNCWFAENNSRRTVKRWTTCQMPEPKQYSSSTCDSTMLTEVIHKFVTQSTWTHCMRIGICYKFRYVIDVLPSFNGRNNTLLTSGFAHIMSCRFYAVLLLFPLSSSLFHVFENRIKHSTGFRLLYLDA